jgi:acylaminoacyl-peptidase
MCIPHGGPHSTFALEYLATAGDPLIFFVYPVAFIIVSSKCFLFGADLTAGYADQGYVVLLVNFRGSLAFGQASIDSLPGKVGRQDVDDVNTAVTRVLDEKLAAPNRVCVYGGSHGGLLGAHLTGQFPERYKAAALRNPVIDIVSMAGLTDIPDWCFVESGLPYTQAEKERAISSQTFEVMQRASPIAYVDRVCAPTLLCIGGQDLRVPPSQGLIWHNSLLSRGIPSKVLWFPEDSHALASLACEAECFVHILCWVRDHVPVVSA